MYCKNSHAVIPSQMLKASTGHHCHVVRHENCLTKPRSPPKTTWKVGCEVFMSVYIGAVPLHTFLCLANFLLSDFILVKASHFSRNVCSFKKQFHWLADSLHAHAAYRYKITMVWLRNRLKPSKISLTHPKNRPCRFSPTLNKLPLSIIWVQPVA